MHSSLIVAALALPLTLAAPYRLPSEIFRRQDNGTNGTCSLAGLQQPANTLTAPAADLELALIALGQGTQNYTCANATATPAAIGAVASLFNASCAVANNAALGSIEEEGASIGAHFFVDNTTPEFDIIGLGETQAKKAEAVAAPQATDVPWLRLEAQQQGTTSAVKQIYRLNTKGGVAPATCEGQTDGSTITVEYEAQYWIYASSEQLAARRMKRSLGMPLA